MKKNILILLIIFIGILFSIYILNNKLYIKKDYIVYAFQTGSFDNMDNATKYKDNLPSSIVVKENNTYKVYVGIYKDIDIVNKMLVYFEDNNINIYLKNINVDKEFYNTLNNYEKILINTNDNTIYNKVNQSVLDLYINGVNI